MRYHHIKFQDKLDEVLNILQVPIPFRIEMAMFGKADADGVKDTMKYMLSLFEEMVDYLYFHAYAKVWAQGVLDDQILTWACQKDRQMFVPEPFYFFLVKYNLYEREGDEDLHWLISRQKEILKKMGRCCLNLRALVRKWSVQSIEYVNNLDDELKRKAEKKYSIEPLLYIYA